MKTFLATLLTLLILLPAQLLAAVTVEGTASTQVGQGVTSLSWTHDSGASGSNCIAVVGSAFRDGTNVLTSSTFNGDALSEKQYLNNTGNVDAALWYRLNPDRGSFTAVVNFSTGVNAAAGAQTYCGVDQGTPFGTVVTATDGGAGTATEATLNVTNSAGDLAIDVLSRHNTSEAPAVGASQTQQYQAESGPADATSRWVQQSTESGTGTITLSWTWTTGKQFAQIGVPLKAAGAAALRKRAILIQ